MCISSELLLDERCVPRVGRIEYVVDFFEGAVLGLGDEEPDNKGLYGAPAGEDDVKPPANLLQSDGVGKLVDQHSRCE